MVLPMIVYGVDDKDKEIFFGGLNEVSQKTDTQFRIVIDTDDTDDAIRAIQEESHIAVVVLGVESLRKDKQKLAIRLGKLTMMCNRDHYVVYLIKQREELELVLPLCARSAGVLVCPVEDKPIRMVFTPVFEDYHRIYENETSQDGKWLNLKSAGKVYRIRLNDVIMVQAVDKMVEFHTEKQNIAVYSSMDQVEKMLDETFMRCHRSYFINSEKIQYIDFREMTIHLLDGSAAPLARSFKEAMNRSFAAVNA
ncbi:MAG: LytTR family transcriptional regulator [Clostridia bacterium]|nr:LytTR family transcriptional regulator [Clostridia bacterium]